MVRQTPKMTALVVSAIRNLREVQGSTPKEILNYVMSEYNANKPANDAAIQRKLCTALKRGLDYGILKCVHGHYCLNTDPETVAPTDEMLGPMDRGHRGCKSAMRKKRKRRARASGRKSCKSRSGRRRKRAASGRKRRRHGRGSKCAGRRKSRGRSRRGKKSKSSRRRGHKRSGRRSRRDKSSCRQRHAGEDIDMLAKDPVETRHREGGVVSGYAYDRERERSHSRGRQSRSRTRTPSHSRSSGSSDREGNEGNHRDGQIE